MSNMSYCRFRNTLEDLRDCYDNMDEIPTDEQEKKSRLRLIKLARMIADDYGDEVLEMRRSAIHPDS